MIKKIFINIILIPIGLIVIVLLPFKYICDFLAEFANDLYLNN